MTDKILDEINELRSKMTELERKIKRLYLVKDYLDTYETNDSVMKSAITVSVYDDDNVRILCNKPIELANRNGDNNDKEYMDICKNTINKTDLYHNIEIFDSDLFSISDYKKLITFLIKSAENKYRDLSERYDRI